MSLKHSTATFYPWSYLQLKNGNLKIVETSTALVVLPKMVSTSQLNQRGQNSLKDREVRDPVPGARIVDGDYAQSLTLIR